MQSVCGRVEHKHLSTSDQIVQIYAYSKPSHTRQGLLARFMTHLALPVLRHGMAASTNDLLAHTSDTLSTLSVLHQASRAGLVLLCGREGVMFMPLLAYECHSWAAAEEMNCGGGDGTAVRWGGCSCSTP